MIFRCVSPSLALMPMVFTLATGACWATPVPSAGEVIRSLPSAPVPVRVAPELRLEAGALSDVTPGGERITLSEIRLSGNTVFTSDVLLAKLGDFKNKSYDLAGLRDLANRLTIFYREAGYSFAKVYVPQQAVNQDGVELVVLEGAYGDISVFGEPRSKALVESYMAPIRSGDVINGKTLETVVLVLGDIPGIRVAPVLRPGVNVGEGNLDLRVEQDDQAVGFLTYDNQGSRFSGDQRLSAGVSMPGIFGLAGHQLDLSMTRSNEELQVLGLGYGAPLNGAGTRWSFNYSGVKYDLTNDINLEDITGRAEVFGLTVKHPLRRSQRENINIEVTAQKRRSTAMNGTQVSSDGIFHTIPVRIGFNRSDDWLGSGSWRGQLLYTKGFVDNYHDDVFEVWDKYALDLTRRQLLTRSLALSVRYATQRGNKPITDSSEQMGLGGTQGVRAYPSGEGAFTNAYVSQVELTLALESWSPYVFVDRARGFIHGSAETTPRNIGGYGVGTRWSGKAWSADTFAAWKRGGGTSSADAAHGNPVWMFSVQYSF
jgi:hemolysin activation/secretion protein